jgi:phage FluMu protein Com
LNSLKIAVVALEEEDSKLFIKHACGMPVPAGSGFKQLGENELQFSARSAVDPEKALAGVDQALLIVHNMDLISVQRLRTLRDHMRQQQVPPYHWVVMRPEGEDEFKISCIECGQKMMIPDGRRGVDARCPKCRKVFTIPSRDEYFQMVTGETDTDLIKVADAADPDSLAAIVKLLAANGASAGEARQPAAPGKTKIRIRKNTES